ncbi:MAG: hypothetical protein CTY33_09540 [Methylotenera sp.]|nr:MAG: hypothetical protein CTY33_09540 [Methylotenera sp.]
MSKYYPPRADVDQFHCILCGVYARQIWHNLIIAGKGITGFTASNCQHCHELSFWYEGRMVVPSEAPVPPAHIDIPSICLEEYNEARDVVARSPRAAAALLRLCLQKMMIVLGETGDHINEDIGSLVKKGLPIEVQQALDICRVVGNNAVHPGEIELSDNPEIAYTLFEMINFIVEDRISRPQKIASIFRSLPEGALNAIARRDGMSENN